MRALRLLGPVSVKEIETLILRAVLLVRDLVLSPATIFDRKGLILRAASLVQSCAVPVCSCTRICHALDTVLGSGVTFASIALWLGVLARVCTGASRTFIPCVAVRS